MEFDQLLVNKYWHLIGHRNELPKSGDFIRFKIAAGDVVIFNDEGEIRVFDNICPHRGAYIFNENTGNQPTTCKYHGWTFKNGKTFIPNQPDFIGCEINKAGLNEYKVDWCGDFIFFSINPVRDLYDQLDGVSEILENISFNISESIDINQYEYECYWPIAIENALEPYHISLVHPSTLATLNLSEGENIFYGENSVWYSKIGNIRVDKQLKSLRKYFNIDYSYAGYMSIYLFPFSMISSTYGYTYSVQNFYPLSKFGNRTGFSSRLLRTPSVCERSDSVIQSFLKSSANINRKVFEEDHSICKIIPAKVWSSDELLYKNKLEEKIDHFRKSCRKII